MATIISDQGAFFEETAPWPPKKLLFFLLFFTFLSGKRPL